MHVADGVDRFGHVDVLVDNAGIFHQGSIADTPVERYRC